jgi:hypothetical protein
MKTSHGWIQGYNAQVLVEEASGVIVAQEVTAHSVDSPRLRPMLDHLDENLTRVGLPEEERRPKWFTADAGYCSENNLRMLAERQIDAYLLMPTWPPGESDTTGEESRWKTYQDKDTAEGRDAGKATDLGRAGDLRPAQSHHRTGSRTDQAGPRLPAVSLTGPEQGSRGIHTGSPDPQSPKALAHQTGPNGISKIGSKSKGPEDG